jgi:hypothetical protein
MPMEPTIEQLQTFYRVVRQAVILSSYIAFVEILDDRNLYVHMGRYDNPLTRFIVYITPDGRSSNYE